MSDRIVRTTIQIGDNPPETIEAYFTRKTFERFDEWKKESEMSETGNEGVDISELIEIAGKAYDSVNNYLALDSNHLMQDSMKLDGFREGLREAADKFQEIYFLLGGENVWSNSD